MKESLSGFEILFRGMVVLFMTLILTSACTAPLSRPSSGESDALARTDFHGDQRPFNLLVMGTDILYGSDGDHVSASHKGFAGRSDTMMLIMVDPDRRTICGISIPRDTVVEVPGCGRQKINAANAIGGPALAQASVANMFDMPIDYYAVLNVQGLVQIIDELGGIAIDVPKPMRYVDHTAGLNIDLAPGMHTLNGYQAMGFVRFRHDDLGDIGRIQRQQMFLRALVGKIMEPASWSRLPQILALARASILTDLPDFKLWQTANLLRETRDKQLQFAMLPGQFGGGGTWVPDLLETHRLIARLHGLQYETRERHDLTIHLRDASSFPGLVQRVAERLRRYGYKVVVGHNEWNQSQRSTTEIIAQRGNRQEAELVAGDLGRGNIISASLGDIYSNITVVVGDDLERLMQAEIASH